MVTTKCLEIEYVPFVESNALTLKRLSQEHGILPHELLYLNLIDFNFDVAVTFFADKKAKEMHTHEISTEGVSKNQFATKKDGNQFTRNEFEKAFGKAFTK